MDTFAAGIVPYIIIENVVYYLLGLETSNNKWSGFVGGSNVGEGTTETAFREFNEETVYVFDEYSELIREKLITIKPKRDTTSTGKNVYIWFIELPEESVNNTLNFLNNKSKINFNECYYEKSILRWFTLQEIKNSKKILFRLKEMMLTFDECGPLRSQKQ